MTRFTMIVRVLAGALVVAPATIAAQQPQGAVPAAAPAPAQPQRTPRQDSLRAANRLDSEGKTTEARALFAVLLASAPDDLARAQVHRAIAMSHAFDGDCANTVKHERMVMDYWKSREAADPQNAFYMQGEMANEAARVCIDNGQLDEA
ncbi:MAG: hypothetical protein MUF21_13000, partial [Gemmatimonadaceae bacterium]|nr:hypothetical protein [Gemmatimonadaceae bacterium]